MTDRLAGSRRRFPAAAAPLGILVAVYVALGVLVVEPRITTDGLLYLAETRSAVLDGDVDLADEYRFDPGLRSDGATEGRREFLPRDLDGRFLGSANEGIVVLFAPLILLAHVVAGLTAAAGGSVSMDGYDTPYVLAIGFGSNAMVAAGLALLVSYARRFAGAGVAVGGAIAIWLGSTLFHWAVFRPGHAHAPAVLLESLFVVLFLIRARDPRDRAAWLVLGATWGLAVSVRPITGLYAAVPLLWLAWLAIRPLRAASASGSRVALVDAARASLRPLIVAGLLFVAGAAIGRLPQFVLTGDVTVAGSAYYDESGFFAAIDGSRVAGAASLLLDPAQGTLWWAPIMPFAIVGLGWWWRRDRLTAVAAVLWVASIWFFVGLLGYPERFGGPVRASRHLVEATPVYVLGAVGLIASLRTIFERLRRVGRAGATILTALIVGLLTAWGTIQFVATEVMPSVAALDPAARVGQVLTQPSMLNRLFSRGGSDAPEPGIAFVAGRLGGSDPAWAGEAWLALLILAVMSVGLTIGAWLALRWTSSPASDHVGAGTASHAGRWAGRAAWGAVLVVGAVLVAPSVLRPRVADAAGSLALTSWRTTGSAGGAAVERAPAGGRIERIVVGGSPSGNGVVAPPKFDPAAASEPATAPAIRLGGSPLFGDGIVVRLPQQASIDIRANGRARMRIGPWGPEQLLHAATGAELWTFPGPSAAPGTWTDSAVKRTFDGDALVVRIDSPWPVARATVSVMVAGLPGTDPATVVVEGSTDGTTFEGIDRFRPVANDVQQLATGQMIPVGVTTSTWIAIDLLGAPGSTMVNGFWVDLELVPDPLAIEDLSTVDSGELEVEASLGSDPAQQTPVAVDIATGPTAVEGLAWRANDLVVGGLVTAGPLLLGLAAVVLLGAAVWAARLAGRGAGLGLLAVAVGLAAVAITALPRTAQLPRTQALRAGLFDPASDSGDAIRARPDGAIVSLIDGATYASPLVSIPAGSSVDRLRVEGKLAGAEISVRSVASDGTPGPWLDLGAFSRSDGDAIQFRVVFGPAESRLVAIRVDYRPPLGR